MSSLNDHVPELMEKGGFDEIVDKEILNDLGGDDDLVLRRSHVKRTRTIAEEDGQILAKTESLSFLETSALEATNVEKAF
ncbi:putative small GTPase [Arabidopsis thaliana]